MRHGSAAPDDPNDGKYEEHQPDRDEYSPSGQAYRQQRNPDD
jgi:hypothetical protein